MTSGIYLSRIQNQSYLSSILLVLSLSQYYYRTIFTSFGAEHPISIPALHYSWLWTVYHVTTTTNHIACLWCLELYIPQSLSNLKEWNLSPIQNQSLYYFYFDSLSLSLSIITLPLNIHKPHCWAPNIYQLHYLASNSESTMWCDHQYHAPTRTQGLLV